VAGLCSGCYLRANRRDDIWVVCVDFASQTAEMYLNRARRSFDVICTGFYALVAVGFLVSLY